MRQLPIDVPALCDALDQPNDVGSRAYLDLKTGAVEFVPHVPEDLQEDSDVETLFADVLQKPDRWLLISPLTPVQRHRVRARFADEIDDEPARLQVLDALESATGFAAFDRVVRRTPGLREAWTKFRDEHLRDLVHRWLEAREISAVD